MEKNSYYEGTLTLKDMPDRQEARELVAFAVAQLEGLPARTKGQEDDLKKARDLAASWK